MLEQFFPALALCVMVCTTKYFKEFQCENARKLLTATFEIKIK